MLWTGYTKEHCVCVCVFFMKTGLVASKVNHIFQSNACLQREQIVMIKGIFCIVDATKESVIIDSRDVLW